MKKLLLASTSTLHGGTYLSYLQDELADFFESVREILFVPYAQPSGISCDEYAAIAQKGFGALGKKITGLHTFSDKISAITQAQAFFVGGGNTFLLLTRLYELGLMPHLKAKAESGTPYLGTSAGTNLAGVSIQNTNDMPIIYPPSLEALGLISYNINPHYLDPDPKSTHKGETRETRIREFHCLHSTPVIGLREGSFLRWEKHALTLHGGLSARLFQQGQAPIEIPSESVL